MQNLDICTENVAIASSNYFSSTRQTHINAGHIFMTNTVEKKS